MECHFRVLDEGMTLSGPGEIVEPIAFAYRRFKVADEPADTFRVALSASDDGYLEAGDRRIALVPGLDRMLQVYQCFLNSLMDRIGAFAVLHAGALVSPGGKAVVLGAPSGHGKTSLSLELAHRGLGFMSDDFAPLDLSSRVVFPYPRTVGIIPGGRAPIPEVFARSAREPDAVRMFGKSLIDVGQVLGDASLAQGPAPLAHVVLLTAHPSGMPERPAASRIQIACRPADADEFDEAFADVPGVRIEGRDAQPHLRVWQLHLDHTKEPTRKLLSLFDSEKVVLFEKQWDVKPDFSATPRAIPIKRRQAAEFLGREMLNRRGRSRLLARYDDNLTALFLDLAGALRDAECWSLSVGNNSATADLVEQLIAR